MHHHTRSGLRPDLPVIVLTRYSRAYELYEDDSRRVKSDPAVSYPQHDHGFRPSDRPDQENSSGLEANPDQKRLGRLVPRRLGLHWFHDAEVGLEHVHELRVARSVEHLAHQRPVLFEVMLG